MIEKLYDIDNLHKAFKSVKKQSGWKEATQLYEIHLIRNLSILSNKIKNKTYRPSPPNTFPYNERGKLRIIESYTVEDRIVQNCLVNEILLPLVTPHLIYDNAASLKNRGVSFFNNRLFLHLKQFTHKYGYDGYILLGDFSKYFDNLRHDRFLLNLQTFGADEEVLDFCQLLLDQHIIDVSYMSDDEYSHCYDIIFNSIDYQKIPKSELTKSKIMRKSMGIGSAIAQIGGIVGAYKIDNLCTIVSQVKGGYGRYMDDFYKIARTKEELVALLAQIKAICKEEGIFLNEKKTQIVPLRHSFTILKIKYIINSNGSIVRVPCKKTFKRQRHKLKHFKNKLDQGMMTLKDIERSQKSWRGNLVKQFGVTQSMRNIDAYYKSLFGG